ncbi:hypothetical protein M0R45_026183 [Rubus argutus]|uniref:Uncharacterized protein n=1 Tax=Rubus argutus TaxID=59490 RepID=A0AAW1WYJ6_RUBAR
MKRKRGHKNKKGKAKGPSVAVVVNLEEETGNLDECGGGDNDDNKDESGMEVDTPSSTGTDQQAAAALQSCQYYSRWFNCWEYKIKSSKAGSINHSDPVLARGESPHEKESNRLHQESRYNKQELDTALMKVMKMDAAEPFNVPVNLRLGDTCKFLLIELFLLSGGGGGVGLSFNQDYFDVIDTPMDFGTICSNLEPGC